MKKQKEYIKNKGKTLKVVSISDTHDKLSKLEKYIPNGDILTFSGDLGTKYDEFYQIMKRLPHKYKILTPGNHDYWTRFKAMEDYDENIVVLQGTSCKVDGINIFGHSWCKLDDSWRLMQSMTNKPKIPKGMDILLTHIPPHLVFDLAWDPYNVLSKIKCKHCGTNHGTYYHWGDKSLNRAIIESKPKYHCFGHNHDDMGKHGKKEFCDTYFVNASSFCVGMKKPFTFDITVTDDGFKPLVCLQDTKSEMYVDNGEVRMKVNSGQTWKFLESGHLVNDVGDYVGINLYEKKVCVNKNIEMNDGNFIWKYFSDQFVSSSNTNIVLDVDIENKSRVLMWNRNGRKNQRFRFLF